MYRFGPHIDPPLAQIPEILTSMQCEVFQTTLRDPRRLSKEGVPDEADQQAYRLAGSGAWGMVHSSLLTSLGSPDPRIRNGSAGALVSDANLAASLGLQGVCFHTGYQKGHDSRDAALEAVAYKLREVVGKLKPGARVMLENGCEGTELGQTIEEIGIVVRATGASPEQLGVTLDTCHLHVSGFDLASDGAAEELARQLEEHGLSEYLCVLHLNDAKEACGSHRDRHAPPGDGTIGEGLRRLVRHSAFSGLPCILEISRAAVPGAIAYLTGE